MVVKLKTASAFLFVSALLYCATAAVDTIVVIGSSTAEGVGASTYDSSWVGRYTKYVTTTYTTRTVLNLAKGGYTSYQLLPTGSPVVTNRPAPDTARNITRALKAHPKAIILNIVSNDFANGYPSAEYLKNIDTLLAIAKRNKIPFWTCTIQPRNFAVALRDTLHTVAQTMLQKYVPHCIDFWNGFAASDYTIITALGAGDGIHLNNTGHRMLFTRVVDSHLLDTLDHLATDVVTSQLPGVNQKCVRVAVSETQYDLLGRTAIAEKQNTAIRVVVQKSVKKVMVKRNWN